MSTLLTEKLKPEALQQNKTETAPKKPPMYRVVMYNDDYTPMDFVVHVLEAFFSFSHDKATALMWQVHTEGRANCGVFTRDIAETKVAQVNDYAREQDHPLLCEMESV